MGIRTLKRNLQAANKSTAQTLQEIAKLPSIVMQGEEEKRAAIVELRKQMAALEKRMANMRK